MSRVSLQRNTELAFGGSGSRRLEMGRSPPPNNFRAPAASGSGPEVAHGTRAAVTRACAAGTWNSSAPDDSSGAPPAQSDPWRGPDGLSYARQPQQQGSPLHGQQQHGSPEPRQPPLHGSPLHGSPLHGSPLGRMPSEPGVRGGCGADTYKEAFASRDGGGRDGGGDGGGRGYSYGGDARRRESAAAESSASQLLLTFARVALEGSLREQGGRRDYSTTGDRDRGGNRGDRGAGNGGGGMGGDRGRAQRGYRPAQSASWVRERLLGGSSNANEAGRTDIHAAEYNGAGVGGAHLPPRDAEAAKARRSAEAAARRRAAQVPTP